MLFSLQAHFFAQTLLKLSEPAYRDFVSIALSLNILYRHYPDLQLTVLKIPHALLTDLLDNWPVARLATITAHHQPHAVPVVFVRLRDHLFVPIDGKQKRHARLQRLQNIAHTPQASLLVDYYGHDWTQLWWVRIDGIADQFEPEAAVADALSERLSEKYPQYQSTPLTEVSLRARPTYLRLSMQKISGWAQSQSTRSISDSLDALTHPSESR